jgi:hypothetical protein
MKITYEPSINEPRYYKVVVDTLTNCDYTGDLVNRVLDALRMAGHHQDNINEAALEYVEEQEAMK